MQSAAVMCLKSCKTIGGIQNDTPSPRPASRNNISAGSYIYMYDDDDAVMPYYRICTSYLHVPPTLELFAARLRAPSR